MELRIEYLSPHDLTPYKGNARKHEREDLEQIKESIRVDGFNDPIGIWGAENLIVEGHGRQLAAILMLAAYRHIVFDFDRIADYYAKASKKMQELMEHSALVIIDYNDAIANGYANAEPFVREDCRDGADWKEDPSQGALA